VPDAITTLRNDHRSVEKVFKEYQRTRDSAAKTRQKLVATMIRALSVHAAIEEQVFYPAVRARVEGTDRAVLEAMEEHHIVKWELSELDGLDPDDERFGAKVTVLIENVRHHVAEEEGSLFPAVRAALGRKELLELGDRLEEARRVAPTRPHPRSPDEPPANLAVGAIAGVIDRAAGAVRRATSA
jgi:hemerythrin superfamily protein